MVIYFVCLPIRVSILGIDLYELFAEDINP